MVRDPCHERMPHVVSGDPVFHKAEGRTIVFVLAKQGHFLCQEQTRAADQVKAGVAATEGGVRRLQFTVMGSARRGRNTLNMDKPDTWLGCCAMC